VRSLISRAGLLGSLTAIALAIISFLPLLDIAAYPVAGYVSLAVILATLTARWRLPRNVPGALGAVMLGCLVYFCGYFDWIFFLIPKAVIFPILIFIGLEITAQSLHATSVRHYAAVVLACVPALAYLALITLKQVLPEVGKPLADLRPQTQHWIATVTRLSGGFIVTSLLWGTFLTHLIDGRVKPAAATLLMAGAFAWFGIIHSPLPSGPIKAPGAVLRQLSEEGRATASAHQTPYHWAAAYATMAFTVLLLGRFGHRPAIHEVDAPRSA
jgi:AGZA family xanthine/uracil permease-like MFS transporter